MVFCHHDGIIKSEEEDLVYTDGEKRVVLADGDTI